MAIENETNRILRRYLQAVQEDIELAKTGAQPWPFTASGKSRSETKIVNTNKPGRLTLNAPGYLFTLFEGVGVRPGRIFPWEQITQWLRFKSIAGVRDKKGRFLPRKDLAYIIADSIWRSGTAIFRGTRAGIPIENILEKNLPETGQELARAYQQEMIAKINEAKK